MSNPHPSAKPCGAKTVSGGVCRAPAMPNGRCRVHGGATPHGPASASWKNGRYSKYLPIKVAERAAAYETGQKLLDLGPRIAALEARVSELMESLDGAPNAIAEMRKSWREVDAAYRSQDAHALAVAMNAHGAVVDGLRDPTATWTEIRDVWRDESRLISVDVRRRALDAEQVNRDQVNALLTRLAESIRRHVVDPSQRRALVNEIVPLLIRGAA